MYSSMYVVLEYAQANYTYPRPSVFPSSRLLLPTGRHTGVSARGADLWLDLRRRAHVVRGQRIRHRRVPSARGSRALLLAIPRSAPEGGRAD